MEGYIEIDFEFNCSQSVPNVFQCFDIVFHDMPCFSLAWFYIYITFIFKCSLLFEHECESEAFPLTCHALTSFHVLSSPLPPNRKNTCGALVRVCNKSGVLFSVLPGLLGRWFCLCLWLHRILKIEAKKAHSATVMI